MRFTLCHSPLGILRFLLLDGGIQAAPDAAGQQQRDSLLAITASRLIDVETGTVVPGGIVVMRGGRIDLVGPISAVTIPAGTPVMDLGNATLLPGLIDTHVHLLLGGAPRANAEATLNAGFTTVQSLGAPSDKPLRDAIAAGVVVGPRLLTSLGQIQPGNQTADQLRVRVRTLKAEGADVIKIFASGSIRDGGKMNVTQNQLDALCSEAKSVGIRTAGSVRMRPFRRPIRRGGAQ